jgi:hypothetical protein
MTGRVRILGFCAALVLLAGGLAHAQADMTIVVGERVGPVALGMTEMQLIAAAGQPQERLMQGRDTLLSWGLVTAHIPAGAMGVDEITVNDPRYLTEERVHVGSTDTAVVASFGQPMKRATVSGLETLDYAGISIVQRNGMVMQIRIRK